MPPPTRPPLKVVLKDLFSYGHIFFGLNDAITLRPPTKSQYILETKQKKKKKKLTSPTPDVSSSRKMIFDNQNSQKSDHSDGIRKNCPHGIR